MTPRRRKAEFEANLIVIDEPQVLCLNAGKTKIIAVAVPFSDEGNFNFIAASVTAKNWDRYLDSNVDLRFLFTYPFQRKLYTFNVGNFKDNSIFLEPFEGDFPEYYLPSPSLFATDHTEEYGPGQTAVDPEQLFIDGEWEMPEFGKFYQKYSDIYSFSAAVKNADPDQPDQALRGRIQNAFHDKPFRGGSSYLHLFGGLEDCLPRPERLTLDAIQYASPGDVKMNGNADLFDEVRGLVENYLSSRGNVNEAYTELWRYLSKLKFLTMPAERFDTNGPHTKPIMAKAETLSGLLGLNNFDEIRTLCSDNALVVAKITLALQRRIESASAYFAQGRMAFEKN